MSRFFHTIWGPPRRPPQRFADIRQALRRSHGANNHSSPSVPPRFHCIPIRKVLQLQSIKFHVFNPINFYFVIGQFLAWVKSSVQTGGLLTRCSTLFACFITEIDGYAISPAGANHALAFLIPKKETEEEAMAVFRVEATASTARPSGLFPMRKWRPKATGICWKSSRNDASGRDA